MYRKELCILGGIFLGVFLIVAGSSWYAARVLQKTAITVVQDTLPGLADAGEAISRIHENWLRIHLVLQTTDATRRATLIQQVVTNSTEGLWREYGRSIYSEADRQGYLNLTAARNAFLERRNKFLNLAEAGRANEAGNMLEQELTPLYARYDGEARALFAYNVQVGRERGAIVLSYARVAPIAISALTTFLFVLGILFGWRFAWSGPDLISRLHRKRAMLRPSIPTIPEPPMVRS